MKKNTLPAIRQLLNFYEALHSYCARLPRANYATEEEEMFGVQGFIPSDLAGIPFDKLTWKVNGTCLDAYFELKRAFRDLVCILDKECKSRFEEKCCHDHVLETIKDSAVEVAKTFDKIKDYSSFDFDKLLYGTLGTNHEIYLGDGDSVDRILSATRFAIGDAMLNLFDSHSKILKYAEFIQKLESCPNSAGLNCVESMLKFLEASTEDEEDEEEGE